MPSSGRLAAIKLVHLYGYVSCFTHGDVITIGLTGAVVIPTVRREIR